MMRVSEKGGMDVSLDSASVRILLRVVFYDKLFDLQELFSTFSSWISGIGEKYSTLWFLF